jgi:hypothetical protein
MNLGPLEILLLLALVAAVVWLIVWLVRRPRR